MAQIVNKEIETCNCCGCKAVVVEWSCGCITVEIKGEGKTGWCNDCDDFSSKRENCGKSGCPAG